MFDACHYVPILKSRNAEFKALQLLDPSKLNSLTPLFELMPPPENGEDAFINHISQFTNRLVESIGTEKNVFVDLLWIDSDTEVNNKHPLEYVFEQLRTSNIKAIPVTGPNRNFDYQNAVKRVAKIDSRGICIRLGPEDLNVVSSLVGLAGLLETAVEQTDILIDFGSIKSRQSSLLAVSAINYLSSIPKISQWRTLTLAASAFSTSNIQANARTSLERTEWLTWKKLYDQRGKLPRMFSYGDYGIDTPDLPPEFDPVTMVVAASIRYTSESEFLVFKGGAIKTKGSQQYYGLAAQLVSHPAYKGASFSWGDKRIQEYANRIPNTGGSPALWRQICYNHHFTLVVDQLSNLSWP